MNEELGEKREILLGTGKLTLGGVKVEACDPNNPHLTMAITMIRRARLFEQAMACLADEQGHNAIPIAHLAAHALEVGIKAYLYHQCVPDEEIKRRISHNLEKAWNTAHGFGLAIPMEPLPWCKLLQLLHDKPFLLRYPSVEINGLVIPNQEELRQGLSEVLMLVEKIIGE